VALFQTASKWVLEYFGSIPAGRAGGWPCIAGSIKLSTETDVKLPEVEYPSTLISALRSAEREMVGNVEGWSSSNEMLDLRLPVRLPDVTTETMTPPLLFTKGIDDVACDDPWRVKVE